MDEDLELIITSDNIIWLYVPEAQEFVKTWFIAEEEENDNN